MAYELNSAAIAGNMTANPDIRYTSGDSPTAIARYTLAVDRASGDADYIRCVVWGKQAEFTEKYLKKGSPVLVTGRIQTGSYTDKNGVKVKSLEVAADRQTTKKDGCLNMNKVLLEGRLTWDPDVRYTQGDEPLCIARYTLAVTKGYFARKKDANDTADFVPCIAYGKHAEFVKKYLKKGIAVAICGKIQTSKYTNKEGNKVNVTEVVAEDHTFAEKKNAGASGTDSSLRDVKDTSRNTCPEASAPAGVQNKPAFKNDTDISDGFTDLPEDEDDVLPFS